MVTIDLAKITTREANEKIRDNLSVSSHETSYAEAVR